MDLGLAPAVPELDDLIAEVAAHHPDADRDMIRRAYAYAEEQHRSQLRDSRRALHHAPARVRAHLRRARAGHHGRRRRAAARHRRGHRRHARGDRGGLRHEVASLVNGVTKLSKIHFESQEAHQAENYRKLIVSMSSDIRVLVVKLADRLHNMRTLAYMTKPKQIQKAKETLEVYAPLAHRLGIHSLKWELEDLAFATLHPKRFSEIQQMVNQRRPDREAFIEEAGQILGEQLAAVGITGVEITGRAKHFYSIYDKMTRKDKEFNEIYDLTAMRVLVDSVKDCYGAVGIIHWLWKPLPGRFKDYIAMPKLNMYQSLHTTVIGPEGKPLEIQIRTYAMHATAEFGSPRTGSTRRASGDQPAWVSRMMDWQRETHDPAEFLDGAALRPLQRRGLRLHAEGRGPRPARRRDAARLRVRRPHRRRPPLRGRQGQRPHRAAHLHPPVRRLRRDPHLQGAARAVARLAPAGHHHQGALQDQPVLPARAPRGRRAPRPRGLLQDSLRKAGLPSQRVAGSPLLLEVIQEMGFKKADEFYISLGLQKTSVQVVVNKILHRLKAGQAVAEEAPPGPASRGRRPHPPPPPATSASRSTASPTCSCAWPSAASPCRATRSSATSPWAAASRSTARTAPTPRR